MIAYIRIPIDAYNKLIRLPLLNLKNLSFLRTSSLHC